MDILRNAWYMAAWGHEVTDRPLARTILGERIAMFRTQAGEVAALTDRCPHRFAPLSAGSVTNDNLRCPYHGLEFNTEGRCVLNPHPPHTFPESMRVKSYPVLARYGGLWLWMGEGAPDEAKMPDLGAVARSDGYRTVTHTIPVAANYFLMVDNLLDLTHVPILHDGSIGNAAMVKNLTYEFTRDGDTIVQTRLFPGIMTAPFYQDLYQPYKAFLVDRTQQITWMPPGNFFLEVIHHESNKEDSHRTTVHTAHILTPETDGTTHYFAAITRDFDLDSDETDRKFIQASIDVLDGEDRVMVEAQQRAMGTTDFMSLKPSFIPTDGASAGAHRIMMDLLRKERAGA